MATCVQRLNDEPIARVRCEKRLLMSTAGAILTIMLTRRGLLALSMDRSRGLSVMSVAFAVMMGMRVLIARSDPGCLSSAAASSICPRHQHVRGTTAQSWPQEHCEVEVRDYGKSKHKSQPKQRISSLRLYSSAGKPTMQVSDARLQPRHGSIHHEAWNGFRIGILAKTD